MKRQTLTKNEFAEALGISTRTLDRLVASGEQECLRIGARKKFTQRMLRDRLRRTEATRTEDSREAA